MTPFTTFKLGVPVLRHRVRVLYATPRTPTPFEAAVLDVVHRFGAASEYRDWSLETIFEDLLCVPEPRALLSVTLSELKALRVLDSAQPFDDSDGLAIGALTLTERGKKMASEKKLLGRQQEQLEQFAHEPLSGGHCDDRRWAKLSAQRPALAIPSEDFAADWPEQAFVEGLHRRWPDWYRADTQIETMWADGEPEVAWDIVAVDAHLHNGAIDWRCERQDVMLYLRELGQDSLLRTALIDAIFATGEVDTGAWPFISLAPDAIAGPPARALATLGEHSRLLLSRYGAAAANANRTDTAPGSIRVQHSLTAEEPAGGAWHIAWNANHDGCTLTLAQDASIGDGDIATDTEAWRFFRTSLMVNGAPASVALALPVNPAASAIFADVAARLFASDDHQDTAAGLLLTPASQALPALAEALRARATGIALLNAAIGWGETARRLKGKSLPGWNGAMSSLFEAALESHRGAIDTEQASAWCTGLKSLGIADMEDMLGKLLRKVEPLQSAGTLPLLVAQARTVTPTFFLPWLPNLYTTCVVKEILNLDTERAVTSLLGNGKGNRFDAALRELWRQGTLLAKRIETSFPLGAPAPEAIRKLVAGRDLAWFRSAVQDWNRRFDEFVQAHALQEAVQGSRLAAAYQVGADWLAAIDRFIEASGIGFEHVFVVDTNALIDCPDLPLRLRPTQLLVLPATVIDELDKKKMDPQLREPCATAVRHLRAMPEARIRFEIADVSLLPDDYRKTADNRILAVALKYAKGNVRLVTGDQNLSLKAQAMNIIAVGVERFVERPPPQRRPIVPGAPTRSPHPNQRKRTGT